MSVDINEAATDLPTGLIIQRGNEARTTSLSPTDEMRFMFAGKPGQPEFFDYRVGHGDGPPLHRHPWASRELMLEGELRVVVDGEEFTVSAGDFFYTPPNAVHTLVGESETARLIGFNHPGGYFEDLQRKAEPLFRAEGGPDMDRIAALAAEHKIEVLGPPMTPTSVG